MFKYLLLVSLIAWATAIDDDSHAHVSKELKKDDGHGHFEYAYDITNGIGADESGDASEVHGEYHYTTKEGETFKVSYTADSTGYHPVGPQIPTPPPIPEAIVRSLEYIKTHPKHDSDDKKH